MKNPLFSFAQLIRAFMAGVLLGRKQTDVSFNWGVKVSQKPNEKGKANMLTLNITNEQQVTVHLNPKTPGGKTAKLDGKPDWGVVSGNCTVTPSDDGLSATIVSGDDLGTSEISVKADADLGDGVEEVADFVEVVVGGAKATNLGLAADAPTLKPE